MRSNDGSFSIRALGAVPTPGLHILSVSDPGKLLDTFTSKGFSAENVPTFSIRLRAARGVIRGTIAPQLDGAAIKVPDHQVLTLDLIKVAPDGSQTSTLHTVDTDGASFATDPVEPGTYRLRFAGPVGVVPWMPVVGSRSWRNNLQYKGRCWGASGVATTVADCATAPTFTVSKGRFTHLGATRFTRHFGALSGTLDDPDGVPVSRGEVYFRTADAPYTLVDKVDARKGDWIMPRLPVGDYIVSYRFNGPWFGGPDADDATRFTVADDTVVRDIDLVTR